MERSATQAARTSRAGRGSRQTGQNGSTGAHPREPSTRERILDIALELFNEHGYDKTSLREIAQRLGTTKAAIYYHFERKQDILLELHLRLHDMGHDAFEWIAGIEDGQGLFAAWPVLIDYLIDQVVSNRDLFLMHQRNRGALELIMHDERHQAQNEDLEQQIRRLLESPVIPLPQRVRMACSIGAVLSALIGGQIFGDVPIDELAELVRDVVHDML